MTVTELIEQLQKLPADLPVYLADWSEGYVPDCPCAGPEVVALERETSRGPSLPERVVLGRKSRDGR